MNINTLSKIYFDDCGRNVTALELNTYVDRAAGIDIDETKNLDIKRILLSKGSNPARKIQDIICEQDEYEEDQQVQEGQQEQQEQQGEQEGQQREQEGGDLEEDELLFEKIKNETSEYEITRIINELTEDDYERIQLKYDDKYILYYLLQNSVVTSNIELFRNILDKMTEEGYIYYIREVVYAKPPIELLRIIGEQEFYDLDELEEIIDEIRVLNTDGSYLSS